MILLFTVVSVISKNLESGLQIKEDNRKCNTLIKKGERSGSVVECLTRD